MQKNPSQMDRVFVLIPNQSFIPVVRSFAIAKGQPAFTIKECNSALLNYLHIAAKQN